METVRGKLPRATGQRPVLPSQELRGDFSSTRASAPRISVCELRLIRLIIRRVQFDYARERQRREQRLDRN